MQLRIGSMFYNKGPIFLNGQSKVLFLTDDTAPIPTIEWDDTKDGSRAEVS